MMNVEISIQDNLIELSLSKNEVTIETNGMFSVAIGDYIPTVQKGSANGVATLDADGLIPLSQIPSSGTAATVAEVKHMLSDLNAVEVGNIYW